jgi:hypothetical protein
MNTRQRRLRIIFWRGSFPVLFGFVVLVIALVLADRIAPVSPQEFDDENLSPQEELSRELRSQEAELIVIPPEQFDSITTPSAKSEDLTVEGSAPS